MLSNYNSMTQELEELFNSKNFETIIQLLENKEILDPSEMYYLMSSLYELGRFTKAMEIADLHLERLPEDHPEFIKIMYQAGDIYAIGVEFDKSIKCYKRGLVKARKAHNTTQIANGLMDLGNCYADMGELQIAMDHIQDSLKLFKLTKDFVGEAYARANLGYIRKDMGRFEQALNDLQNADSYLADVANIIHQVILWKNIIEVLVELNRVDQAKEYLLKMKEANKKYEFERIKQVYVFAKAIVLKSSSRLRDKVNAVEEFKKIINTTEYTPNRLKAIRHLIDLQLHEYRLFEEVDVLEEISDYLEKMENISREKSIYPHLISSLILKAKLSIIEKNFDQAEQYFRHATTIAKDKDLGYYSLLVEREMDKLQEDLIAMKNLVQNYESILEEQTINDFFDYLKMIAGKM